MNPVLVFDMDETLIASKKVYNKEDRKYIITEIQFNEALFGIILRAMKLREKTKVDAILLLTNNTNILSNYNGKDMKFLEIVNLLCKDKYNIGFEEIFDNIYTAERNTPKGRVTRNYNFVPQENERFTSSAWSSTLNKKFRYREKKDIKTIATMLNEIGKSTENLQDRIYFFDDETIPHAIKEELEGHQGKYITIVPPFGKGADTTVLTPILQKLSELEQSKGGTRKRRRNKQNTRRK